MTCNMANSRYMCPEPLRALSCRKNYVTLGISSTQISEQRTSRVQTRNSSYVLQQGRIVFGVYLILASASCRVARAQYFKSDNPCRTRGTTSYRRQFDNALGVNTARCIDRKYWRCANWKHATVCSARDWLLWGSWWSYKHDSLSTASVVE